MGLGEHILYLLAGVDVPVGHVLLLHGGDPVILQALALPDALHDGEGQAGLHPHLDQVDHDIVTGTDGRGNGGRAAHDQILGVAQPHVRAVGKPRNAHQVREGLGLGIDYHLHGEVGAELRNPQDSQLCAPDLVRGHP